MCAPSPEMADIQGSARGSLQRAWRPWHNMEYEDMQAAARCQPPAGIVERESRTARKDMLDERRPRVVLKLEPGLLVASPAPGCLLGWVYAPGLTAVTAVQERGSTTGM